MKLSQLINEIKNETKQNEFIWHQIKCVNCDDYFDNLTQFNKHLEKNQCRKVQ